MDGTNTAISITFANNFGYAVVHERLMEAPVKSVYVSEVRFGFDSDVILKRFTSCFNPCDVNTCKWSNFIRRLMSLLR